MDNMGVDVSYTIAEGVIDVHDVRGGLKITIDGVRLNQYHAEEEFGWVPEWRPEYTGELLDINLKALVRATIRVLDDDTGVYERVTSTNDPAMSTFELERLGADWLRVAFKSHHLINPDSSTLDIGEGEQYAAPESARGYIVDRHAFGEAVLECARAYHEELESFSLQFGRSKLDDLIELIDDLDAVLASRG